MKFTEPVPVPAELLADLREEASQRGMWVHNAVEEALRIWLKTARHKQRHRRKPLAKHQQLTGDDIRTLVRLHLSREEAREIARFTAWLRTTPKREVEFWSGAIRRRA